MRNIKDGICISASKSNLPHPHDGMLNVWLNLVVYMQLALYNRLKVFTESKIWILYSSLQAIYFLNFVTTEMHYVSIVHIRSRPTIVSYIIMILSFRALRPVAIVLGHVVLNLRVKIQVWNPTHKQDFIEDFCLHRAPVIMKWVSYKRKI